MGLGPAYTAKPKNTENPTPTLIVVTPNPWRRVVMVFVSKFPKIAEAQYQNR
jgi:hypothetical protein